MTIKFIKHITETKIWRSVFRTKLPIKTNLDRSLVIFNSLTLHIHPVKVRRKAISFSYTFYLGMISFFLFVILVVTGIMLMLYYQPAIPNAYQNMKDLQYVVSNGSFLRNMHRWAAHLMVLTVFLHMLRVFFAGAYKPPREFNWVVGVLLLVTTLLLSYTGYLLPYDQLSYWAVTVGSNIVKYVPIAGPKIRFLLLGGNQIGEYTLVRFYVLHCVVLPLIVTLLVALHFWRVRKDGGLH
jgi:quinol-cytochrome oxidoreductase complex cytochrome b subunit